MHSDNDPKCNDGTTNPTLKKPLHGENKGKKGGNMS